MPRLSALVTIFFLQPAMLVATAASAPAHPESAQVSAAHFHHVHLNVTDPKATIAFYKIGRAHV